MTVDLKKETNFATVERQLLLLSLKKNNKENYCICFVSCKFFPFRVLLIETFTTLVQEEEPGKQTGFS